MRKGKTHFQNEPFMARVAGKGDEPVKCTPVVYDNVDSCGIGVFYEEGPGQVWGMITPRNLVAAWRGTEVLRRLDAIKHGTLCAAYYTGVRDPHKSDMESYVEPTIAKIGQKAYDEIMAMPVPEQIIRAILDNQGDDFAPDLYPIVNEVRAGTIQWRQEFADAGIEHPDEVDAKKRAQEETIAKFDRLLNSYARSRDLPRQCNGMWNVESALLTIIKKDADRVHPDHVLVALAGVLGELVMFEFTMSMLPSFGPRSQEEYDAQLNRTKESAINHSAKWLASNPGSRRWWLASRKPRPEAITQTSAKELLRRLFEECFPPKLEASSA